ncbi:MAG: thiamine-phosphate kinase [Desulfosoma sp.]
MKSLKPTVKDLGEFGLIDRLRRLLPQEPSSVLVGLGDDVAVLRSMPDRLLLATCDSQVESVHFLRQSIPPRFLGQRVAAVNLSDIAAMGGTPLWALMSVMLPESTPVDWVEDLYEGVIETLRTHGAVLVGGNTARHPDRIVLDMTLLGEVDANRVLLRRGARVGDVIVVTGSLGASKAGLESLRMFPFLVEEAAEAFNAWKKERSSGMDVLQAQPLSRGENFKNPLSALDREIWLQAVFKHWVPEPRVREGRLMAASGWVHAMIDVSDGLLGDLAHLCEANGVGAVIDVDALPVDSACEAVAQALGQDAILWALSGGEDYELLAAVDPVGLDNIVENLAQAGAVPCRVVGRIVPRDDGIRCMRRDGSLMEITSGHAWDHFGGKP